MTEPEESPLGHFHKIIALHEDSRSWEEVSPMMPLLPKGWFELSKLPREDRIDFTKAYWFSKLPFDTLVTTTLESRLDEFFSSLSDLGIFAAQELSHQPFEIHMVYTLAEDRGFFQGGPPASTEKIEALNSQFSAFQMPEDYLRFFEIHDGFSRYTDTGLLKIKDLSRSYQRFQQLLHGKQVATPDGKVINPKFLMPFYASTQLHSYQCFCLDHPPGEESENLFFSEEELSSDQIVQINPLDLPLSYPTFLHWLIAYLEPL